MRAEVAAAQDAAVAAALAWVERHGLVTRRGLGGVEQVDAMGLTVAVFRQHTSRTADPQLHTHAVISSKVQDCTGMWLALDAGWLKTQQRSLSWVYDAALRSELAGRLGLEWQPVPEGSGQADLAGVPEALTEVFSKRSRQVEAKLSELIARWPTSTTVPNLAHETCTCWSDGRSPPAGRARTTPSTPPCSEVTGRHKPARRASPRPAPRRPRPLARNRTHRRRSGDRHGARAGRRRAVGVADHRHLPAHRCPPPTRRSG